MSREFTRLLKTLPAIDPATGVTRANVAVPIRNPRVNYGERSARNMAGRPAKHEPAPFAGFGPTTYTPKKKLRAFDEETAISLAVFLLMVGVVFWLSFNFVAALLH